MFIAIVLLAIAASCVQSQTELTLPPLPYAYNILEPVLSEKLMHLHHDKHFQTYTTKSNAVLKSIVADPKSSEQLKNIS